jgi:hypothetical protein
VSSTYAQLHHAHRGKSSDKWESYLRTYERLFTPIRDARINIVEIGVQNGGSLEVFATPPALWAATSIRSAQT